MIESTLGSLITPEHRRDAIHVAILPAMADVPLKAGEHVGFVQGNASTLAKVKIGIVDPFLREPVQPGQNFYVCLYPKTVTSLRHAWSHPLIGDEQ